MVQLISPPPMPPATILVQLKMLTSERRAMALDLAVLLLGGR